MRSGLRRPGVFSSRVLLPWIGQVEIAGETIPPPAAFNGHVKFQKGLTHEEDRTADGVRRGARAGGRGARARDINAEFRNQSVRRSYWNGPDYDYNVGPKGNPNGNQIPNNRAQTGFNAFASEPFGFASHNRRNAGS